MSPRRAITWKKLRKILRQHGVEIRHKRGSGEKLLVRTEPNGRVLAYSLQHKCCQSPSSVVWADHLHAIARKFGIPKETFD